MYKIKMKKILSVCLLIISIVSNIYAAQVSDNDGSAFITKSEFDSLKNDFQSQLDTYNNAIDNKIDTAIAAYLAGVRIASETEKTILFPESVKEGVLSIDKNNPLNYKYGIPRTKFLMFESRFLTTASSGSYGISMMEERKSDYPSKGADIYKSNKTVITNLERNDTTTSNSIAQWLGYKKDCDDEVTCIDFYLTTAYGGSVYSYPTAYCMCIENSYQIANQNLIGAKICSFRDCNYSTQNTQNAALGYSPSIRGIVHDWGKQNNTYVSVLQDYSYDLFSNYERDYNWGYAGTYTTTFGSYTNKRTVNFTQREMKNNSNYYLAYGNMTGTFSIKTSYWDPSNSTKQSLNNSGSVSISNNNGYNNQNSSKTLTIYLPMIGFETTYLKNWKQIYLNGSSTIADWEKTTGAGSANSILTGPTSKKNFLGLTSGFPIIKLNKKEKLKYDVKFKDQTKDYVIWVSNRPFSSTGHPDDDTNCLTLKGVSKSTNTSRGYLVKNGQATIETPEFEKENYVYIKWGIYNSDKAQIGGGTLMPTETVKVISAQ